MSLDSNQVCNSHERLSAERAAEPSSFYSCSSTNNDDSLTDYAHHVFKYAVKLAAGQSFDFFRGEWAELLNHHRLSSVAILSSFFPILTGFGHIVVWLRPPAPISAASDARQMLPLAQLAASVAQIDSTASARAAETVAPFLHVSANGGISPNLSHCLDNGLLSSCVNWFPGCFSCIFIWLWDDEKWVWNPDSTRTCRGAAFYFFGNSRWKILQISCKPSWAYLFVPAEQPAAPPASHRPQMCFHSDGASSWCHQATERTRAEVLCKHIPKCWCGRHASTFPLWQRWQSIFLTRLQSAARRRQKLRLHDSLLQKQSDISTIWQRTIVICRWPSTSVKK